MMAKECEEKKARAIKLVEKAQASYEKQPTSAEAHKVRGGGPSVVKQKRF